LQNSTKYLEEDLVHNYLRIFYRRWIIGGMKGYHYPLHEDTNWIIHARYLLSEITQDQLEDLFILAETTQYPRDYKVTASWLASLLKDKKFLPYIERYAMSGTNMFWSAALYTSLFLYNTPNLIESHLKLLISKQTAENETYLESCKEYAAEALRIYDENNGTKFAKPYADIKLNRREKKLFNNVVKFSEILRANINFEKKEELQAGLKQLIDDTVTPYQAAAGLVKQRPIRYNKDLKEKSTTREIFKSAYLASKQNKQTFLFDTFVEQTAKVKVSKQSRLVQRVANYLNSTQDSELLQDLFVSLEYAISPAEILQAVESDVKFKLPGSFINQCFKKLLTLINPSYQLYEEFSVHLLLRGNEFDETAKEYYEYAKTIKDKYVWHEDVNFIYCSYKINK
jgi:hypothetical protein